MADDDQKVAAESPLRSEASEPRSSDEREDAQESAQEAEASADKAEEAAEKVEVAAEKVEEAIEKVEEKIEEVKEEKKEKADAVKVSKKLEGLIADIEKLSVLELSELVKALEVKFNVTASAPIASPVASGGTPQTGTEDGASEQTTFNVVLAEGGANKISVIKAVRELVPTLGLKEAKDLVDGAPKQVLEGVNKETAQDAKTKLEAAGAKVEFK